MERIRKRDLFRANVVHKRIRGWTSGPAEPPRINICWVPPPPNLFPKAPFPGFKSALGTRLPTATSDLSPPHCYMTYILPYRQLPAVGRPTHRSTTLNLPPNRSLNSPFYHAQPTAQQVAQLTVLYVGYISCLFFFALILFWVCFRQLGDPNLDFGLVVLYELESGPHILMEDKCSDQWLTLLPWA